MAVDVVPALNSAITTTFRSRMMRDKRIAKVSRRIRDGTATLEDAHEYAAAVGENASHALVRNITAQALPDGRFYYNIAQRTVKPLLKTSYELINDAADEIQAVVDRKQKVRLNPVRADFPEGRVDGLIKEIADRTDEPEEALKWLGEPIVNNAEAFADDYMQANAEFRVRSGMRAKITRSAESDCCKWCAALAGSWDYGDEPKEIYARHEFCRCSVVYTAERKAQNVWSKAQWQPTAAEYDRMRSARGPTTMTASQRMEVLRQREADAESVAERRARAQANRRR